MELEIVRANPAGNITIFVMNPPESSKRAEAARALMADPVYKAEQVGFVLPPSAHSGNWRLEMAGGEFCANAGRSFGLLAAAKNGLSGRHTLFIETSGMAKPLPVHIDTEAQSAEIEIPAPLSRIEIALDASFPAGNSGPPGIPVFKFEGISHAIVPNMPPDEELVRFLISKTNIADALGVMFYDSEKCYMQPVVWTRAIDTLVFESSCGSGSAALGAWAAWNTDDTELNMDIAQPGGVITVQVLKHAGKFERLSISGKVSFSETLRYRC